MWQGEPYKVLDENNKAKQQQAGADQPRRSDTMGTDDFIGRLAQSDGMPTVPAAAPQNANLSQPANAVPPQGFQQSTPAELRQDLASATPQASGINRRIGGSGALVGTKLGGRFEILEVLGQGGMSVVYKARQDVVDRFVAIKTLKMQLQDQPETIQRFEREIKSLCKLSHPHIVTVFDCIIDEDGQPYIAMDYLVGKSLDVVLQEKRRMSMDEAQPLLVQICSALDHAHKHGIVHRDLKPSNIMLVGDELEFVKVVDFGLARLGQENQKITRSGEVWGSPPYMSPEQCNGMQCDGRSDIYSLGCVMYEMVSGEDPFRGEQVVNTLIKHISEPPPAFAPHLNIPQSFQDIIFKCLEKDPKNRYQTMGQVKDALISAVKQSLAASAAPAAPTPISKFRAGLDLEEKPPQPFYKKLPFKVSLAAVTVVLLVATLRVTTPPHHSSTPKAAPVAEDASDDSSSDADTQEANEPAKTHESATKASEAPNAAVRKPVEQAPPRIVHPQARPHEPARVREPAKVHDMTKAHETVHVHTPAKTVAHEHAPAHHTAPATAVNHPSKPAKSADVWDALKSHRSPGDSQ